MESKTNSSVKIDTTIVQNIIKQFEDAFNSAPVSIDVVVLHGMYAPLVADKFKCHFPNLIIELYVHSLSQEEINDKRAEYEGVKKKLYLLSLSKEAIAVCYSANSKK